MVGILYYFSWLQALQQLATSPVFASSIVRYIAATGSLEPQQASSSGLTARHSTSMVGPLLALQHHHFLSQPAAIGGYVHAMPGAPQMAFAPQPHTQSLAPLWL